MAEQKLLDSLSKTMTRCQLPKQWLKLSSNESQLLIRLYVAYQLSVPSYKPKANAGKQGILLSYAELKPDKRVVKAKSICLHH